MKRALFVFLVICIFSLSGCSSIQDGGKNILDDGKNKIVVIKNFENMYLVELTITNYSLDQGDNSSRIFEISLVDNRTEYYVTDPNRDGNFGSERNYSRESDIEGVHLHVNEEKCNPRLQNIELVFMTKENRTYEVLNTKIGSEEKIKNIWIDHPSQQWNSDPNYCKDYKSFSEKPEDIVTATYYCGAGLGYCYGTITIHPFLYNPSKKVLRVIKKMRFNILIKSLKQTNK